MPWGWATWKDKWELYYDEDLRNILKTYSFSRSLSDLPSDIYKFCTNVEYLDGIHDTWSIPWTTIHYLARKIVFILQFHSLRILDLMEQSSLFSN